MSGRSLTLERRAVGPARRLVDRDQAGEPRHQLMLEREREDRLVGLLRLERRMVRATSASAILRRAHSLERPLPSAAFASGSVTIHGRSPMRPLISTDAGELGELRREHQRLAAIEVGQHLRRHVGLRVREASP